MINKKVKKSISILLASSLIFASAAIAYADTPGEPPADGNSPGSGMGSDTMTYDYSGTVSGALSAEGTEETSDGNDISTSKVDQNAALVSKEGTLTITNSNLNKSGDDTNGDNCNFYGINSILLSVNEKSKAYISGSTLTADSEGSNGIFSTDNGTVYANDNTIKTTADNSRGLDATYSGTILVNKLKISTQGDHSAAIATDRGGGNISATNSSLKTKGSGSPLLYSTGDIEVDNVTGVAEGSQIAGMEGLNTIYIYNSTLESKITKATASDPIANGVIIYQSTSGDAESTTGDTATFEASKSTLKSSITSGSMFYLTNTTANIVLSDTKVDFDSSKANLLTVAGNNSNNWGTAGSNGANVNFTGIGEELEGDIDVDNISSLNLYLLDKTTYSGATSISQNNSAISTTEAPLTVNVDENSKWEVTSDSTVSNLYVEKNASIVDTEGKTVTIKTANKTVVEGDSNYVITVTGSYGTSFKTSDINKLSSNYIDRTDFDKYYKTSTSFGSNVEKETTQSTEPKKEHSNATLYIALGVIVVVVAASTLGISSIYRRRKRKKNRMFS